MLQLLFTPWHPLGANLQDLESETPRPDHVVYSKSVSQTQAVVEKKGASFVFNRQAGVPRLSRPTSS